MPVVQNNDAELVAQSLAGSHDAFRQIVERYQTLICSLAYAGTGSLTQSEDLAQETFVTAWKELAKEAGAGVIVTNTNVGFATRRPVSAD